MTAVTDALRQMIEAGAWAFNFLVNHQGSLGIEEGSGDELHSTKLLRAALHNARAALAEAEKDEGELVAALSEAADAFERIASCYRDGPVREEAKTQASTIGTLLSKHATPEHAKKG